MYSLIPQYIYFCDNCSEMEVINQTDYYEQYDILIRGINDVKKVLRKYGWSLGTKDLCPECSHNKKKDK